MSQKDESINIQKINKISTFPKKTIQNESPILPQKSSSKSCCVQDSVGLPLKCKISNNKISIETDRCRTTTSSSYNLNKKLNSKSKNNLAINKVVIIPQRPKSAIPRRKSMCMPANKQTNQIIQLSGDTNKSNICTNLNELQDKIAELLLTVRENESSIQCLKSQLYAKELLLCGKDQIIQELQEKSQKNNNEKLSLSKVDCNLNEIRNEYKQQQQVMKIRGDLIILMQNKEKLSSNQIKMLKCKIIENNKLLKHFEIELISKDEQMKSLVKSLNDKKDAVEFQKQLQIQNDDEIEHLRKENNQLKQQFNEIMSFSKL